MKWYKRDPDAWRAGVVGLTPEERGVYDTIIDELYSNDLDVPPSTDNYYWSRSCNCDPRMWRRILASLKAKGKVREVDGRLDANRVKMTIREAEDRQKWTRSAREKALEIKAARSLSTDGQPQPQPDIEKKKKESERGHARKTRIPDDWKPNEDHHRLASDLAIVVGEEETKFRDYVASTATTYADHDAAFRNWLKRARSYNRGSANGRHLQDDRLSVTAALKRLGDQNARGELVFGPTPSLLSPERRDNLLLLSKRRSS